jgi:hypothetical protein
MEVHVDDPMPLVRGAPRDADRYLTAALWGGKRSPSVVEVKRWMILLEERGDEFRSHISACQYWLYEQRQRPSVPCPTDTKIVETEQRISQLLKIVERQRSIGADTSRTEELLRTTSAVLDDLWALKRLE